jgi:uncharacterized protein with HEPN domain
MRDDETLLLDMLIAARKVLHYAAELDEAAFQKSDLHQSALVRELQVIGEAARQVSEPYRKAHPAIPWEKIAGMRNRLVHEYHRISLEVVWSTVTEDILPLVMVLEVLVPPEE